LIKIKLKHVTRYIKMSFSKHIRIIMYMDEIQYTYKLCKLFLMKSFMKTKDVYLKSQNTELET